MQLQHTQQQTALSACLRPSDTCDHVDFQGVSAVRNGVEGRAARDGSADSFFQILILVSGIQTPAQLTETTQGGSYISFSVLQFAPGAWSCALQYACSSAETPSLAAATSTEGACNSSPHTPSTHCHIADVHNHPAAVIHAARCTAISWQPPCRKLHSDGRCLCRSLGRRAARRAGRTPSTAQSRPAATATGARGRPGVEGCEG